MMPPEPVRSERVSAQLVASAAEVGFTPPPVALRVKLVHDGPFWTLFVQRVPPGPIRGITEWLEPFGPLRIEFGSRGVLRADFDPLPPEWRVAFHGIDLDMLALDTNGRAVVSVSGSRTALAAFTRRIRNLELPLAVRRVGTVPSARRFLTLPQDEALRAAVDMGYYLIPRPLNLQHLAKRLKVSSASLSERLRRAEGRVITRYVNEGGKSPWDARTLFDEGPFKADDGDWPPPGIVLPEDEP